MANPALDSGGCPRNDEGYAERFPCIECSHSHVCFLPDINTLTKAFYYGGYSIVEKPNQNLIEVIYEWNNFASSLEVPEGGTVDEFYNANPGQGTWAYYTDSQGCRTYGSEQELSLCPSGTNPFRGLLETPTGQSCVTANIETGSPESKYGIGDIGMVGVQEWALFPGDRFFEFGAIFGHGRGSDIYPKHDGLHTRGPRLGFRWGSTTCEGGHPNYHPLCIQCPDKGIFFCLRPIIDTGYEDYCPSASEPCEEEDFIQVPRIQPDNYGNGYVNVGFNMRPTLVTNAQYTSFLNTVAVNDYYADLILWHPTMMPNIRRTTHPDPIHKYNYSCDNKAANLPVTNVNLLGAVYFIKWHNAGFCIPFRYSQYELDSDESLQNCEDCLDLIDNQNVTPSLDGD
jgi:hypothetical protein